MANLTARQVFTHPVHFLAYGFGAGLSPKAPGTMGTLVAIPLYLLLLMYTSSGVYLAVLAVALVAGIFICGYTATQMGIDDPKGVVWDEIVGYLITMLGLPLGWIWIVAGFLLFRLFDIWKPWPIRWVDRHIKGGFGIMFDDVLAALPACGLLNLAAYFIKV
ncbi:MAG TPA: phosphatidylglycerophosphatase A [Gammaproteobacteria bacterium]|jgi:phosphatidylglycerophosphatase A